MYNLCLAVAAACFLVGCVVAPQTPAYYKPAPEEEASADYGAFPSDYKQIITDFMQSKLKDPYSAHYTFDIEPKKTHTSSISREGVVYGYIVLARINAKNIYSAYTGDHSYVFTLRNGKVIDYLDISDPINGHM